MSIVGIITFISRINFSLSFISRINYWVSSEQQIPGNAEMEKGNHPCGIFMLCKICVHVLLFNDCISTFTFQGSFN